MPHPAFRPESTFQTATRAELMPRARLRSAASSRCLHEYEICGMSMLRDEAPMQSRSSWQSHGSMCVGALVGVDVVFAATFRAGLSVVRVVRVILLYQWRISRFRHLSRRLKLLALRTHAMSPSRGERTHMTCLDHCPSAHTLCCCWSTPANTTNHEIRVNGATAHPPCSTQHRVHERSLCGHWPPTLLPTGSDSARRQL